MVTTATEEGVLDRLPEPMLVLDDGHIAFANAAGAGLLGVDAPTLRGRPVTDFLPLAAGQPDGAPPGTEHSLFRADGTEVRVEVVVAPWGTRASAAYRLLALHDVTAHRRRSDALLHGRDRTRELDAQQERLDRAGKWRLARWMHDALQQTLAALLFELDALGGTAGIRGDAEQKALVRMHGLASSALKSTTQMIDELQPLIVEELRLEDALAALCRQVAARTGIPCRFRARDEGLPADLPLQWRMQAYEALREVLGKFTPHADRRRLLVEFSGHADGTCALTVSGDGPDGAPIDPDAAELHRLWERLRGEGGDLSVVTGESSGTTVRVSLPSPTAPAVARPDEEVLAPEHSYDALLRFLYQVPVGLLRLQRDGTIDMINPAAARMLMPLAGKSGLRNLFELLQSGGDDARAAAHRLDAGAAADRCLLVAPAARGQAAARFSVRVQRLDQRQLVATIQPAEHNAPAAA